MMYYCFFVMTANRLTYDNKDTRRQKREREYEHDTKDTGMMTMAWITLVLLHIHFWSEIPNQQFTAAWGFSEPETYFLIRSSLGLVCSEGRAGQARVRILVAFGVLFSIVLVHGASTYVCSWIWVANKQICLTWDRRRSE